MARSSSDSIATRISLTGGDEVKRQLEQIGTSGERSLQALGTASSTAAKNLAGLSGASAEVVRHLGQVGQAGERAGNQVRASLLAATSGMGGFTAGTRAATASSGQMRAGLINLGQQAQDVFVSLQGGQKPLTVLLQQGSQIGTVFATVPGILGATATAIRGMITPTTLAAAGAVALAAGLALVVSRAVSSESSARKFDVILKATGKSGQATGKELEELSGQFHDVGLSTNEAREALTKALQAGLNPSGVGKIVRAGAELNAVFGEGSLDKFIDAADKGGAPLEEFAKKLGIIPGVADETVKGLRAAADEAKKASQAFDDAFRQRNQAIADEGRNAAQQIADLTRKKGTAEEEAELASKRRIEDINRQHNVRINGMIRQRNQANAAALAAYNQQITDAAQKALDKQSLVSQVLAEVLGSTSNLLGPLGKALLDLNTAWNNFLTSLAKSGAITGFVTAMGSAVVAVANLIKGEFSINALGAAILLALPVFALLRLAALGVSAALGPIGLALAIGGIVAAFIDWNKAWEGAKAAADGLWKLLVAFSEWLGRGLVEAFNTFIAGPIRGLISWLDNIISKAQEAARAIAGVFGGGGAPSLDLTSPVARSAFARGGMVRGPSGVDRVPIWATAREFVVNAAATSRNLPLLEMINGGMNLMPNRTRFATGGLVAAGAGAGGTPVHIHMDGNSFPLRGEQDVVEALSKHARGRRVRSGGKAPSWVG